MTRSSRSLLLAVACFVLAALVFFVILDGEGLADAPADISVTPPVWLESKFLKWDGVERWWDYFVTGWWFTDGDYWHVGQWRTFEVSQDVAADVLVLDAQGRRTMRLCRLGFIDGSSIAELATCVNGTQALLPFVE